jgi:hypothetical protein
MSLGDIIEADRDRILRAVLEVTAPTEEVSREDVRQFVTGFIGVLGAGAKGDLRPRDEYLAAVIPAIRDGGMSLAAVLDGMVRVSMGVAAAVPREHLRWVTDFCAEYTRLLLATWGKV